MTTKKNAAQVAVQAEPCPKQATKEQWAPCLLLEGLPTACGITTNYPERLPGLYDTSAQAMAAAEAVVHQRPNAIGISAKRVEVPA